MNVADIRLSTRARAVRADAVDAAETLRRRRRAWRTEAGFEPAHCRCGSATLAECENCGELSWCADLMRRHGERDALLSRLDRDSEWAGFDAYSEYESAVASTLSLAVKRGRIERYSWGADGALLPPGTVASDCGKVWVPESERKCCDTDYFLRESTTWAEIAGEIEARYSLARGQR